MLGLTNNNLILYEMEKLVNINQFDWQKIKWNNEKD